MRGEIFCLCIHGLMIQKNDVNGCIALYELFVLCIYYLTVFAFLI